MPKTKRKYRPIEHIAVPRSGADMFATAGLKERVTVWSFPGRKRIGGASTILDFGGPRLALTCSGNPKVVAGSWKKGVEAYDGAAGGLEWSRPDLKNVQHVRDLSDGNRSLIGVGLEDGPYHVLKAESGNNHAQLTGIIKVFVSCFASLYALVSRSAVHLSTLQASPIWKAPLVSFAILDAAFSPDHLVFSESAGCVYCFDFYGSRIWTFQPELNHHVLRVAWDAEFGKWLAVDWNTHGGPKQLFEINGAGSARLLQDIGDCSQVEFLAFGKYLITSNGCVISTRSGQTVWQFTRMDGTPGE